MVQLLQEDVRRPERLVSLAGLLDNRIEAERKASNRCRRHHGGGRSAPCRGRSVSGHCRVALDSASLQVRNQATIGGNLLQRQRCPYFRDVGYSGCNKRAPGTGCSAIDGDNRWHAVLGTSDHCIAANPSDLAVALVALDGSVEVRGPNGQRTVPLIELHRLPGDTPHIETVLEPGEVIAAITVPASTASRRSHYLKVRDRASFEFAVVSAAVALDMNGSRIRQARVALGGVRNQALARPQGGSSPGRRQPRSGDAPHGRDPRCRRRPGARA